MKDIEIKEKFKFLENNASCLTESQIKLIFGFKKFFKRNKGLSEKQEHILLEIADETTTKKQELCQVEEVR